MPFLEPLGSNFEVHQKIVLFHLASAKVFTTEVGKHTHKEKTKQDFWGACTGNFTKSC